MEKKWMMISRLLKQLGEKDLANFAFDIHCKLECLYDTLIPRTEHIQEAVETTLQSFVKALPCKPPLHTKLIFLYAIKEIVCDGDLCVGCLESGGDCYYCKFGEMYGVCDDDDSLFMEFYNQLQKRIEEVEKEWRKSG